jgi:acyl-CoA thioesterase
MSDKRTAQEIADLVCDQMRSRDRVATSLRIEWLSVTPGSARLAMEVRDDMLNAFDICHGGIIATLADTAFALACNSHGQLAVASGISVDFIAPARSGDRLEAVASELEATKRTGLYDVVVRNQAGATIAIFRGRSANLSGRTFIPRDQAPA